MSGNLHGKVAVVTGASKGIGAAIARRLAEAGATVVVNYASSKEAADRLVAEIEKNKGKATAVQANLARPAEVDRLFAEVAKAFGKVDILVNNAGIYQGAPLDEITAEHFHKHFDLNVLGLILATKAAVKLMPKGGSIINISSVVSSMPLKNMSVYSATKAAVDAVTGALAQELGPKKIRVNSLSPGMIETEGLHSTGIAESDFRKAVEAQTPLGRIGQPDDIARVAVFFASDDAAWVTGQSLLLAGGQRQ